MATGNNQLSFDGSYTITYFDAHGALLTVLNLVIIKRKHHYDLSWFKDDVLVSVGIGLESANALSAGFMMFNACRPNTSCLAVSHPHA
ncbi:hypothetical protein [Alginatibacterium sediminis]|uniref:hypothetical protein n=1 Tax=Alginatibacterium sediminis TaxID=2164068 RepID=UPI0011C46B91|nr:hypothetical protein [Alginatibacterium sediminis]